MTHTCTLARLFHSSFSEARKYSCLASEVRRSEDMCYQASVLEIKKRPVEKISYKIVHTGQFIQFKKNDPLIYRCLFPHVSQWEKVVLGRVTSRTEVAVPPFGYNECWAQSPAHFLGACFTPCAFYPLQISPARGTAAPEAPVTAPPTVLQDPHPLCQAATMACIGGAPNSGKNIRCIFSHIHSNN